MLKEGIILYQKIKQLLDVSLVKTIRFNVHYFGIKALVPYVLISKNVIIKKLGGGVFIKRPKHGCVKIGFQKIGIWDKKYERSIWENNGIVSFEGTAVLGSGVKLSVASKAELSFGDGIIVTGGSTFICNKRINLGRECLISWDVTMMDTDFHYILDVEKSIVNKDKEISIGNHVWIGCRCLLKKGVIIADNSVIAAGSNISGEFVLNNIVIGDKGIILKKGVSWNI